MNDAELALRLRRERNGLSQRCPAARRPLDADTCLKELRTNGVETSKRARLGLKDQGASGTSRSSIGEMTLKTNAGETEPVYAASEELAPILPMDMTWLGKRQRSPSSDQQEGFGSLIDDSAGAARTPRPLGAPRPWLNPGASSADAKGVPLDPEQEAAVKVRETLAIYNHERLLQMVREAERVKRDGGTKRPDLKTLSSMMERKQVLHAGNKVIGHVPGVKVGDSFCERAQLCALGLHGQTMAGIDTIAANKNPYGRNIAVAIVLAGGYEDDVDNGETFTYTGAGGNDIRGSRRQSNHQALKGVNEALANSARLNIPVRVFRGYEETTGTSKIRVFTYDGLYQCTDFWVQKGLSGFDVVKFNMQRQQAQPPLSSQQVYFVRKSLPSNMKAADRPGLITVDISNGKERFPICLVNDFEETLALRRPEFDYVMQMNHRQPTGPCCTCTRPEDCADPKKCACACRNTTIGLPYVEGRLKETGQGVVYECGPHCKCGPACPSRVVQRGITHRLEVFLTKDRGLGVRSWDFIAVGSFICEYTGELLTDAQARQAGDDSYLFNIDPNTDGLFGAELQAGGELALAAQPAQVAYSIDALSAGNVGRFINHSCTPNAVVQSVLFDHHNPKLSHIALFAYENIVAGQEITYDYNYKIGTVIDANNEEKVLDCRCGNAPPICKGRLY